MVNIGITINIKDTENIWNNGITQNVINLALVLKNIKKNYNIFIVNTSENSTLEYKIEGINIHPMKDKVKGLDILFILGSQIRNDDYDYLKEKNCKIIYYSCGANYIIEMQNILFKKHEDRKFYNHKPDEIWNIPQNYKTNKYYFETIYNVEVKEVPFVWSTTFLDYIIKNTGIEAYYKPTNEKKRISCFEPNIDVVKFAMYDILIVEQTYKENKDLINHFYVTNALKIKESKLFIDIMNNLDIVKEHIVSFESRYKMPYFLSKYTDIVISHQWENPLNYAYLDALYLNYPLVHNAHMIKDGGYYYNDFNVKEGKEQLLYALKEHDNNIDNYNERSQKILDKYLPTNEESIKKYDDLIEKILNK
jgi:uncharacterized protein DUF2827